MREPEEPYEPQESDAASFGAALRHARRAAGLTQEALAERAGVGVRTLQGLERGESAPLRATARRLAAGLGLPEAARARFLAAATPPLRAPRAPARAAAGLRLVAPPPARPAPTPLGGLPAELSSFVGRERDLVRVGQLLETARLVTLTGPGGVGKTRVALRAAAAARDRFAGGVGFVGLAALNDPQLVAPAVARTLGVRPTPGQPVLEALRDALRDRSLLLVLDNCEHLLDACAALAAAVLEAGPGVTILATSREALGVAGETVRRVAPLGLPEGGPGAPTAALARADAVRLFAERAAAVAEGFAVTAENAPAVATVCRRLDGIPLALELAAARVRVLPVPQLLARLEDRFRLLTGGSRTGPVRQQTLRATVDWSYALLTPAERRLFARLAVFAGGWTLEAAEAVGAGAGVAADEVLDLLTRLVDQSLAVAEAQPDATARYRLLETLRQYAQERLEASREAAATRERHAAYYLALAEQAAPATPAGDVAALDRLEREHANLREALGWWAARGAAESGLRAATALSWFWGLRGYRTERRAWLGRFLALPAAAAPAVRARAVVMAGGNAVAEGDAPAGRALLAEGLRLARAADDLPFACRALGYLGICAQLQGDLAAAEAAYRECLALSRPAGGAEGRFGQGIHVVTPLVGLGAIAALRGESAAARAHLGEALAVARASGRPRAVAGALEQLGDVAAQHGDDAAARAHYEEALAIRRAIGDKEGLADVLSGLGAVARAQHDPVRAGALGEEALAIAREAGAVRGTVRALSVLGALAGDRRDLATAHARHREGLALARAQGAAPHVAQVLADLGEVALAQGHLAEAAARYRESVAIRCDLGLWPGVAHALEGVARLAAARRQPERALRLGGAAAALRAATGTRRPPLERARIGAQLQRARRALGSTASLAWAAGEALSPAQAVAEALAALDAAPPVPAPAAAPGEVIEREGEVLRLAAARTDRQIAAALGLSEETVGRHLSAIFRTLGVTSRAAASAAAARHGRA